MWIDTHCHLDAPEFGPDHVLAEAARERAASLGVRLCVIPAVMRANFDTVRVLAHRLGDAYALGIHPLCVPQALESDLEALDHALTEHRTDPRLVAVGEIGLDFFVPALCEPTMRERQTWFYREQLKLARKHQLPVILHVRRSADALLKHLRALPVSGIGHAFNGSEQQAQAFLDLGFKLGFGGTATFEAAQKIRRLAASLPLSALVLETDSPDIPPQWLYTTAAERSEGKPQGVNTPAELPRIAHVVAGLRGISDAALSEASCANACAALPGLARLLSSLPSHA
ncbi:TatD DNase family protein [Hydrogenophaga palleronii]|uniref:TatD DNase family protein n=1 Tax=Hydrogenophaga palleronii TaxID=65655 RepID=A0ABU1WM94_9BURK|nr:TatD family hydrolase [Hydrogenophaga palleronii]MDR7150416.1 TatD DNase family protein [Hydrogenophaga palleronii]